MCLVSSITYGKNLNSGKQHLQHHKSAERWAEKFGRRYLVLLRITYTNSNLLTVIMYRKQFTYTYLSRRKQENISAVTFNRLS